MRDKVQGFIAKHDLIKNGEKVLVALSGGADSVSLLHVLISIKEIYNLDIRAAHFNHMIRGAEADRDESFCRELCGRLGVPFFLAKEDIPYHAEKSGESLELCGRRMRYEALERFADELGGAKIATAHNLNDNTETVLMNLTRGSGVGGMGGIPPKRGMIIRPLLSCSRAEIESYCEENGLDYVTDSTNLDDDYTRNKLRHKVLPELRELNPSVDEGVMKMSSLMREADDYLNNISISELNKCKNEFGYSCEKLLRLDKPILSYAVKNVLNGAGAPVDSLHIELVCEAIADSGSVDLGRGLRAVCAQGTLRVVGRLDDTAESVRFTDVYTRSFSIDELRRMNADESGNVNKKFLLHCIPCDIITNDTLVRRREVGDTFTDPRRGVTKTLKKLMNELKIPRERRSSLRVVANGNTVLWLEGTGVSKQGRIPDGYDGKVYLIDQ